MFVRHLVFCVERVRQLVYIYSKMVKKPHLVSNGPPDSPERLASGWAALRFDLKELAHPATGGTPLPNRFDALPSNTIHGL